MSPFPLLIFASACSCRHASGRPINDIPQEASIAGRQVSPAVLSRCAQEASVMTIGTVKFLNTTKGFGFIQPDDGSKDVFVHVSAVERAGMGTLVQGQQLSYDVVTERGKQAAGNLRQA